MRQIRMLRAMRRELETELRILLTGHKGGNPGYSQGESYGLPRQLSTLPAGHNTLRDDPAFAAAVRGDLREPRGDAEEAEVEGDVGIEAL